MTQVATCIALSNVVLVLVQYSNNCFGWWLSRGMQCGSLLMQHLA